MSDDGMWPPLSLSFEAADQHAEQVHAKEREAALAQAERMAEEAMTADTMTCRGSDLMHKIFYMEYAEALVPGHIYSRAGISEARISGVCEYCFDRMFPDTDD